MTTLDSPATAASAIQPASSSGQSRIQTVDAVRGAVIILMALDHVRDYISSAAMNFSPTDLTRTTTAIFFTRWITHFCAPVFAFTAGIGAFLWLGRSRTKAQLSRFLLTRGLWLIFLELTVLRFILVLEIGVKDHLIILSVIWMLGLSMVVLAGLVHLPTRVLAVLSVVVIVGHNLFDKVSAASFGDWAWLWNMLHQLGVFRFHDASILVGYPLVPWVAVMAAGYCFGQVFQSHPSKGAPAWDAGRRRQFLLRLGVGLSAAFIVARALNVYGDPFRWATQSSRLFTVLSFLNTTKYPPSFLFLLMTLGPAMIAMAWLEHRRFSDVHPLMVFGRVPFFFFTVHLAVIHAIAILLGYLRYGWTNFLLIPAPSLGSMRSKFPADFGFDLWVVYVVWIAVIVMMYPLCRWFAGLKQRRRHWWLSYL
ncbi:MAG TPA: heparan-alpha-glucosaminide N-acetyltransferase domain-containing protein [Candidatus Angelobacter sp.]